MKRKKTNLRFSSRRNWIAWPRQMIALDPPDQRGAGRREHGAVEAEHERDRKVEVESGGLVGQEASEGADFRQDGDALVLVDDGDGDCHDGRRREAEDDVADQSFVELLVVNRDLVPDEGPE